MRISIQAFSGTIPRIGARLLDANQAELARDAKFWSGELRPLQQDTAILDLPNPGEDSYKTLYKYIHPEHQSTWLASTERLNIVKGPVAADIKNRTYCTGLATPRVFDSDLITANTKTLTLDNTYPMAVPRPEGYPQMAVSGTGSGSAEARAYLYTYTRQWDSDKRDEGQPSSPARTGGGDLTVTVELGQTVTLTEIQDLVREDITHLSIYRTSTGATSTSYNLVRSFNLEDARAGLVPDVSYSAGQFTFTDNVLTEDLSSALVSLDWTAPLDELTGLISLNNGILVGYVGNDIYFSAPYQPHAWPAKYRQTIDYPIKGLGHYGNTVVVLTEAFPILLTVTSPDAVVLVPINENAPCLSERSIVNSGDAVYYASSNGILKVNSSGILLMTQPLYSKEEWARLNPASMLAALYEGRYYAFYTDLSGKSDSIVIDFVEANAGISTISGYYETYFVDPEENKLYYIKRHVDGLRYIWELEGEENAHKVYTWRSKKFLISKGPTTFSAANVLAEYTQVPILPSTSTSIIPRVGAFSSLPLNTIPIGGDTYSSISEDDPYYGNIVFKLFIDGKLFFEKSLSNSKPFRIPSGLTGTEFQIELSGSPNVYQVNLATSMSELGE